MLLRVMANDDLLYSLANLSADTRRTAGMQCRPTSSGQTAIKIGKGGLKGITLSPEQLAEWIDSFPISAYVSFAPDHCYSPDQANSSSETPHKDEGIKRRNVDTDDRRRISEELGKCSHPLETESDVLYNIVNGQVAPAVVNVSDALVLGALMLTDFRKSLPAGFHAKLSSPVKTMKKLKHGIKIGYQVFDLESIFIRLLLVVQQREMELLSIFGYELCAVHLSLGDEYGCLRKGNKAVLIHRLGVKQFQLQRPDIVIVDAQQPLYQVSGPVEEVWGVGRFAERLALCPATEKILVFDQYVDESAKDHERRRRAGIGSTTFNLAMNIPLPSREAVMKNKHNKRWPLPSSRYVQSEVWVTVDSIDDGVFGHDEADITIISYMLRIADDGSMLLGFSVMTRTYSCCLSTGHGWRRDLQDRLAVQMEKWDGVVLDVNAPAAWSPCNQRSGPEQRRVHDAGTSSMCQECWDVQFATTCCCACHPRL